MRKAVIEFDDPDERVMMKHPPRLARLDPVEAALIEKSESGAGGKLILKRTGYNRSSKSKFRPGDPDDLKELFFRSGHLASISKEINEAIERNDYAFFERLGKKCGTIWRAFGNDPDPLGRFIVDNWVQESENIPAFCFLSTAVLTAVCQCCLGNPDGVTPGMREVQDRVDRLGLLRAKRPKIASAGRIGDSMILHLAEHHQFLRDQAREMGCNFHSIC